MSSENFVKIFSGRALNRSPGVQRVATLDLLETWSSCSRPFAILPVSAVSDAQKLATGNFLHVRACFCGTFCTTQKVPIRFPYGKASRFCEPQISPPQQRLRTNKIKTFPKRRFEVLQTSNQRTQTTLRAMPIKSFCRPWRHPSGG